jgi:hypothetical protein
MNETWLRDTARAVASKNLGTVLCIGHFASEFVEELPEDAFNDIVVLEPDAIRARHLTQTIDDRLTVLPYAFAPDDGAATLRHFTMKAYTALRAPTGLSDLFPSLRETDTTTVETLGATSLLHRVTFDQDRPNVLVLGAPGEERTALDQFADLGVLDKVSDIITPLPSMELFEEADSGSILLERLENLGYRISAQDQNDPDIALTWLKRDDVTIALKADRDALAESLEAMRKELADAREHHEASLAEQAVKTQSLTDERNTLAGTLETVRKELDDAKKHRETLVEEHAQETQALNEEQERARTFCNVNRHALKLELRHSTKRSRQACRPSPAAFGLLDAIENHVIDASASGLVEPRFNLDVFREVSNHAADNAMHQVILDVKSVPRSGLHYMKRQFEHILQDRFSFCEWYQEPGCCKRMPCVYPPDSAQRANRASLRMLKSHDFELTDPIYPVTPGVQRFILTRDPIFVLTSNWLLNLLDKNRDTLKESNIHIEKIFYLHEPEVLPRAYQVLEDAQVTAEEQDIAQWLVRQQNYLTAFSRKWAAAEQMPRTYIVPYQKTPQAIQQCLAPIKSALSLDQLERLDTYAAGWKDSFKVRQDPFQGPTPHLTALLERHAKLFRNAAKAVREDDAVGLFSAGIG